MPVSLFSMPVITGISVRRIILPDVISFRKGNVSWHLLIRSMSCRISRRMICSAGWVSEPGSDCGPVIPIFSNRILSEIRLFVSLPDGKGWIVIPGWRLPNRLPSGWKCWEILLMPICKIWLCWNYFSKNIPGYRTRCVCVLKLRPMQLSAIPVCRCWKNWMIRISGKCWNWPWLTRMNLSAG